MNFLVHIIFTLAQAAQAWKVQGSQACCVLLPLETHQILWSSFVINIHKHPEVCMLSSHLSCPIVHFVPWHQSRLLMKTNACCYVVCKKKTWVCVKTGYPYFPLFPMVFMCHDFFWYTVRHFQTHPHAITWRHAKLQESTACRVGLPASSCPDLRIQCQRHWQKLSTALSCCHVLALIFAIGQYWTCSCTGIAPLGQLLDVSLS